MDILITNAVEGLSNIRDWISTNIGMDAPFNQVWGWNVPAVTKADILKRIDATIGHLTAANVGELTAEQRAELEQTPSRLGFLASSVVPNMASANALHAVPALFDELGRLDRAFPPPPPPAVPYPDWEKLASDGYLPKKLALRLNGIEKRLERLAPDLDQVEQQMSVIRDAYQTAEQLPETQASLEAALKEVSNSRTQAQSLTSDAASHEREAKSIALRIEALAKASREKYDELEDAYRGTATKGLASSFQAKARSLGISVRWWVGALAADLIAGAAIGYFRFEELQKVLSAPQPAAVIWGNLLFSILSIAAPVWLGWVATKQITQRFKLAEDYGFKASVASAYEAWKSEAKKQDKEFEKRLFGIALSRLDEAPLRFVEVENYGSPWHELTSSPAFAKALDKVPELQGVVAKIISHAGGAAAGATAVVSAMLPSSKKSANGSDEAGPN